MYQLFIVISIFKICSSVQYSEFPNSFLETIFDDDNNTIDDESTDWDYILYSQRWSTTACTHWKDEKVNNTCVLPSNPNSWIVHGLWPTKTGTNGPNNCNSAMHFDPTQLQPILNDLNERWTNVEANTKPNSFWKHEWDKHGTCAAILPQLDSIYNYFQQGLNWNKQYNLEELLKTNNIVPGKTGYTIETIYNAVLNATGKHPQIECIIDEKSKESLISEIRICFDKNMQLIDCVNESKQPMLTNCSGKKPVMYYLNDSIVSDSAESDYKDFDNVYVEECIERNRFNSQLTKFYAILKFLIWLTF